MPCTEYDREGNPEPEACDWDDTPPEPEGRQAPGDPTPDPTGSATAAPTDSGSPGVGPAGGTTGTTGTSGGPTPTTGGGIVVALLGLGLVGASIGLRRHRAVSVA